MTIAVHEADIIQRHGKVPRHPGPEVIDEKLQVFAKGRMLDIRSRVADEEYGTTGSWH
jgi:hypothetical protein